MSFSMTRSANESFTLTQAKYLASKVTADMRRCQQLYGYPSNASINDYGTELALLLRDGFVRTYEFGFVRLVDNERVLTWRYSVDSCGDLASDDRPGRIIFGVDTSGANFRTYLSKSSKWDALTTAEQGVVLAGLPIQRIDAPEYGSSLGGWHSDLQYSASGVAMRRHNFRPFGT
jgi:hypothetical protein